MFEIVQCYDNEINKIEIYWLKFNDLICDKNIARELSISTQKYRNILRKFGAMKANHSPDLFFFNKEDAEKALEWIEAGITARILANDI